MKVRIKIRPSGLINGQYWPKVGETIDLPDGVALGMLKARQVEPVVDEPEETRPAPASEVQTPGSAPDPAHVEPDTSKVETATPSAPADTSKVETATPRKGRASAVANPDADAKSDAGADGSASPAPANAPTGKA